MRDGAGRVRDLRWTCLNPEAEALLEELEGPGGPSALEGVAGLLDVAAGLRVLETGQPHTDEARLRLRRGEVLFHTLLVRQDGGLALWLREAPDACEEARRLREELHRERAARLRAEEALAARREPSAREAQLLAGMELLAEEARFRERFIGILGHDLRNPLNAISLSARALWRRGPLTSTQQDAIQRIEASAARMAAMISDILDLTRARLSGGIPLTLGPTRLGRVCRQVVEELSAGAPERCIVYEEDDGGEGCWDAQRLAQVLSNLVGNALEHGAADTPVLLRLWRDGDWQALSVSNTGVPIAPHQLATLFDPFRQGDGASERRRGGLGLGLFIVKEIVQAHGGRVTVSSSLEDGTTFTVRLPYDARRAGTCVRGPRAEACSA